VFEWDQEGKAWNVTVPALAGCYTFGSIRSEALERTQEAIAGHLEALRDVGVQMP
jgi:predicted RNase H-like HicB family nuclease